MNTAALDVQLQRAALVADGAITLRATMPAERLAQMHPAAAVAEAVISVSPAASALLVQLDAGPLRRRLKIPLTLEGA